MDSLGECVAEEFYTHGGFQDYTDYGKYYYEHVDFSGNPYFVQVSSVDEPVRFIDHFEEVIDSISDPSDELVCHYDFDRSIVSEDDYWYVYEDPDYDEYGNYDLYLFDSRSMTLYYFHNNI